MTISRSPGSDPNQTGFNGKLSLGSSAVFLSSIEAIKLTSKDDAVKVLSIPAGITLDASKGIDTLDMSLSNQKAGAFIDSSKNLAKLGPDSLQITGFDIFIGTTNDDTFKVDGSISQVDGGAGKKDVLDFSVSKQGIVINDASKSTNIIAKNIEQYIGSAFDDTFKVDGPISQVDGWAGKKDVLDFSVSKQGVVINDASKSTNIIAKNIE